MLSIGDTHSKMLKFKQFGHLKALPRSPLSFLSNLFRHIKALIDVVYKRHSLQKTQN